MKTKSEIDKIHESGRRAIIDGDRQVIIGDFLPKELQLKIKEFERKYSEVSSDAAGDIVCYK